MKTKCLREQEKINDCLDCKLRISSGSRDMPLSEFEVETSSSLISHSFWLAIIWWRLSPCSTSLRNAQTTVEGLADNWCQKSVEGRPAIGYGSQFHFSGRPHNPTSRFWSSPTSVVTAELFLDRPGPLYCVPQEMGFHLQWTMWLWRNPDNGIHRQLLSIDQIWRRSTALMHLHEADEAAIDWLTAYGS